ncbi:hypothetical protein HMPREF3088_05350 [Corynebacterium sp. HMSC22B11]|uniref:hypothetical protein n=1 Tax=Corynebacterium sp. HMSC22B11 TaxID=1581056 RepID=UPI0008A4D178|nr:hypothetical protein [Corynebacterium sp. HMSC22B11]OFO13751.1 hypothetical protein HMPREF3088_05350 [Corynebacterium sp. HMSC22B11]
MPLIVQTIEGPDMAFDTDACTVTDSGALVVYTPVEPRVVVAGFSPTVWQTFHFEPTEDEN